MPSLCYEFLEVVSNKGSDIEVKKTQLPKESHTTGAVTRDGTTDMDIGQGDVWEEVSLVDAEGDWNSIETDYYCSDDDVTVEKHTEGDWLSIDHKHASHQQQSSFVSLDEEINKLDISLRITRTPPPSQLGMERSASPHDAAVSTSLSRKRRSESRPKVMLRFKSVPCKPVCSKPAAQPWKAESGGRIRAQTALAMSVNVTKQMRERARKEYGLRPKETRPQAEAPAEPEPSTCDAKTEAMRKFFFDSLEEHDSLY